ncbi:PREDICTED: uncharacterized protein LOC108564526 [Nicrophorus vespilloides]|uniref:Uncharacterized protein LOC108564526 n=1 Tax=Nicrophorus vespilloides TaxID=110193 RepID=A0ABM1MWY1_NICVS|nr:PREDICTED: uncharacterized protein LOC108564526 [Nicrophorus vespilloides]
MSLKERKHLKKIKKENARKKVKLSNSSECEDESEHELYYYANDRVKLMKEILKTLKTRKIKSLTPESLKNFDMEEIKTMLLEELLGISNKRLKKIFEGQNTDDESSSTDEDQAAVDVISLDEISDEEDFCFVDESPNEKKKMDPKNDKSKNSRRRKIKNELKLENTKPEGENEKLLSVLELLELQARARAIRSQLAIEAESKSRAAEKAANSGSDSDVIVESPKVNEIVISSSESEPDNSKSKRKKGQKVKIIRERRNVEMAVDEKSAEDPPPRNIIVSVQKETAALTVGDVSEDVINLDVVEIEGIDD